MRRVACALALAVALASCSGTTAPQHPAAAPPSSPPSSATPVPATVRFAAVGDLGDGSAREARVARGIAAEHARRPLDLVLLLGDLIYPDGDPDEYAEKFARPYRPVLEAGIETRAVLGNHDVMTDAPGMAKAFRMPARYYTFARGPVQFFALDSNPGRILGAERAWLRRELARSRAAWKVAFLHVPLYSSGMHGPNTLMQQTFGDLFAGHGVDLVLAGHDHDYERTRPIRGVTYVVSGGGCCPRSVGRSRFTSRSLTGLHFVVVEASASRMLIQALDPDGAVLDRATIVPHAVTPAA
jgi:acid phosphatase